MLNSKNRFTEREPFRGAGTITSVEYQKTNAERVNIYIDEVYAFSVADIVAAEWRLKPNMEISAEEVAEIQAADMYNLELAAALNFISLRPRSETEVRNRLKRNYPAATSETTDKVLNRLKELKYINDAEFVRFWVESRAASAPRGRHLLRQELQQKGIAKNLIEDALEKYLDATSDENEESESGENETRTVEEQQALEIARRKATSYAAEDWAGFYRKLGGFLLRRGYDYGITGRVLKTVWRELKDESPGEDFEEF